jgi:hypothetical protein
MLSSSSRCDHIYKHQTYVFGYTLLCYLSQTLLLNNETPNASLSENLEHGSSFGCDQIYQKYDLGHTLLCLLSQTFLFNKPTSLKG